MISLQQLILIALSIIGSGIFFLINVFIKKKELSYNHELYRIVWIVYLSSIFAITLLPLKICIPSHINYNLIPFKTIISYFSFLFDPQRDNYLVISIVNLVGNITLFIPFGYFVNYFSVKKKNKKNWINLLKILLFSFLIEILQLIEVSIGLSFGRTIDIDDIILNFLGGIIGIQIYYVINKFLRFVAHRIKKNKGEDK